VVRLEHGQARALSEQLVQERALVGAPMLDDGDAGAKIHRQPTQDLG
jgi:hypothetical protein